MMKLLRITVIASAIIAIVMQSRQLRVESFPIPGLPGVPDAQHVAVQAASKQLAPWVHSNEPIIRDWNAVYPTVATLPGLPFSPNANSEKWKSIQSSFRSQAAKSTTGLLRLPPGDYVFDIRVYCTAWYNGNIHRGTAGHRGLWILGPLRGARANVLATMYDRASGKDIPWHDIQTLSWAIQAGLRYDEFPPRQQQMVNELIPDLKSEILGSFTDQAQAQWNTISSTVPGLPSFDSALGSMGDTGQTILSIRNARDEIISNANDFDSLSRALAPPLGKDDENAGDPPWSIVNDQVYERLITEGFLGSDGKLEIRVTPKKAAYRQVVAFAPGSTASDVGYAPQKNDGTLGDVPENIGYAPNHPEWQPLTQDSPNLSGR